MGDIVQYCCISGTEVKEVGHRNYAVLPRAGNWGMPRFSVRVRHELPIQGKGGLSGPRALKIPAECLATGPSLECLAVENQGTSSLSPQ
jgi:hypothetical protein